MRKNFVSVFIMLVLFISMYGFSQIPLCPSDCEKLKPEAKEHYKKALDHIDRVYWKGALEELREAAKVDPDHVNLHFLLSRIARQRARIDNSLEESQKYYSIAENALLSFEGRENLTRDQQAYLENALVEVKKEKASLDQRERQRMEIGYKIIMEYMNQIGWFSETKPAETTPAVASAQAAAPTVSFSTPAGFPGSPASNSPFGISPNLSGTAATSPSSGPGSSSPLDIGSSQAPTASSPSPGSSPFDVSSSQAPVTSSPSPGSSPLAITGSPSEPSAPASAEPSNPFGSP
jgi:hypothetical protein